MRRLWGEIDLHVAAMLLPLAPAGFFGWWWLAIPLLIPQGRIGTRVYADYPRFGRRPWAYLVVNELLVLAVVAATAAVRAAIGATT